MVRRIILSGGGTGGHIYPAITIAQEMAKMEPTDFLFVGSENGLERQIIPKLGYPFTTLKLRGFERRLTLRNFKTVYLASKSLINAVYILKKFKPEAVVGTGGYVCGPILLAASLLGIPTLIQEQNVVPGITNKILSGFVSKIALGYEEARVHMKRPDRCVVTGNPVRADFMERKRVDSRISLGIPTNHFVVLAAGGSRGAQSINRAMAGVAEYYKEATDVTILHVTGEAEYAAVETLRQEQGVLMNAAHLRLIPYMDDMPSALAAADLAVYRAGAVGLAELTVSGVPSILIPYPYATANHQKYNAEVLVKAGAAVMVDNNELNAGRLIEEIERLRTNPDILQTMGENSKTMGKPYAAKDIAELVFSLIG